MDFKAKIVGFLFLVLISGICETYGLPVCHLTKLQQLSLAAKFQVPEYEEVVIFLGLRQNNTVDLVKFLTNNNRVFPKMKQSEIHETECSEAIEKILEESVFAYKTGKIIYYVYPAIDEVNHEIFAKYIAKNAIDSAKKVKIVLVHVRPKLEQTAKESEIIAFVTKTQEDFGFLLGNVTKLIEIINLYSGSVAITEINGTFVSNEDSHIQNCMENLPPFDVNLQTYLFLTASLIPIFHFHKWPFMKTLIEEKAFTVACAYTEEYKNNVSHMIQNRIRYILS